MYIFVDKYGIYGYNYIHQGRELLMGKKKVIIMPKTKKILEQMGSQIKLARLRRKLSMQLVAERAGLSRSTVGAIEKGSASVSMGSYAAVLQALNGMEEDLLLIAKEDVLGRKLQDLAIQTPKRAPR